MECSVSFKNKEGQKVNVVIARDPNASNPRKEYDHAWTWVTTHEVGYSDRWNGKRYEPRDFENDAGEIDPLFLKNNFFRPLFLYRHGEDCISVDPFSCPWDSGQMGFAFIAHEDVKNKFGGDYEKAADCLRAEVREMNMYLSCEVYGIIVIVDKEEHHSCWGFYLSNNDEADFVSVVSGMIADHADEEKVKEIAKELFDDFRFTM